MQSLAPRGGTTSLNVQPLTDRASWASVALLKGHQYCKQGHLKLGASGACSPQQVHAAHLVWLLMTTMQRLSCHGSRSSSGMLATMQGWIHLELVLLTPRLRKTYTAHLVVLVAPAGCLPIGTYCKSVWIVWILRACPSQRLSIESQKARRATIPDVPSSFALLQIL